MYITWLPLYIIFHIKICQLAAIEVLAYLLCYLVTQASTKIVTLLPLLYRYCHRYASVVVTYTIQHNLHYLKLPQLGIKMWLQSTNFIKLFELVS